MPANLNDILASLPAERRAIVEARTGELIAEEYSLRELRLTLDHSQAEIAERLGVKQAAVSKFERRADMYISSLRAFIQAVGGELEIVAKLPGRPPVRINQFESLLS